MCRSSRSKRCAAHYKKSRKSRGTRSKSRGRSSRDTRGPSRGRAGESTELEAGPDLQMDGMHEVNQMNRELMRRLKECGRRTSEQEVTIRDLTNKYSQIQVDLKSCQIAQGKVRDCANETKAAQRRVDEVVEELRKCQGTLKEQYSWWGGGENDDKEQLKKMVERLAKELRLGEMELEGVIASQANLSRVAEERQKQFEEDLQKYREECQNGG